MPTKHSTTRTGGSAIKKPSGESFAAVIAAKPSVATTWLLADLSASVDVVTNYFLEVFRNYFPGTASAHALFKSLAFDERY